MLGGSWAPVVKRTAFGYRGGIAQRVGLAWAWLFASAWLVTTTTTTTAPLCASGKPPAAEAKLEHPIPISLRVAGKRAPVVGRVTSFTDKQILLETRARDRQTGKTITTEHAVAWGDLRPDDRVTTLLKLHAAAGLDDAVTAAALVGLHGELVGSKHPRAAEAAALALRHARLRGHLQEPAPAIAPEPAADRDPANPPEAEPVEYRPFDPAAIADRRRSLAEFLRKHAGRYPTTPTRLNSDEVLWYTGGLIEHHRGLKKAGGDAVYRRIAGDVRLIEQMLGSAEVDTRYRALRLLDATINYCGWHDDKLDLAVLLVEAVLLPNHDRGKQGEIYLANAEWCVGTAASVFKKAKQWHKYEWAMRWRAEHCIRPDHRGQALALLGKHLGERGRYADAIEVFDQIGRGQTGSPLRDQLLPKFRRKLAEQSKKEKKSRGEKS